jgi:hypothetical protein
MNTTTTKKNRAGLLLGAAAVVLASTGGAYAAGAVITSSAQIKSQVVNSGDIKNGTIKVKDLNAKTVTAVTKLEGWKPAALGAPWTAFPNHHAPGFRIDAVNGVVHLRGAMSFNSDNGSDKGIFELPAGYRPVQTVNLEVLTANPFGAQSEFGMLEIEPDGDVKIYGEGDDRFVSLDGLSFSIA